MLSSTASASVFGVATEKRVGVCTSGTLQKLTVTTAHAVYSERVRLSRDLINRNLLLRLSKMHLFAGKTTQERERVQFEPAD